MIELTLRLEIDDGDRLDRELVTAAVIAHLEGETVRVDAGGAVATPVVIDSAVEVGPGRPRRRDLRLRGDAPE